MATPNRPRISTTLVAILLTMTPHAAHATYYDTGSTACRTVRKQAAAAGWPRTELDRVVHTAARESLCNPHAHNANDPTQYGSRGLLQINGSNVRYLVNLRIIRNANDLYNPTRNLKAGLALWHAYGWRPWNPTSTAAQ